VVTRRSIREWLERPAADATRLAALSQHPVVAYGDEPLRAIAFRMAETGVTRLPVVQRRDNTLIGMVALRDLLTARTRILEAEHRRERPLGTRLRLALFGKPKSVA
jgi:CIC family chloride channel protein